MRIRWLVVLAPLLIVSCGRYAEFTLPPLDGGTGSASFEWIPRPAPVLDPGAPGSWDAVDALNPSVVKRGEIYYNFYSGYDGQTWHTGLAVSPDGAVWEKRGRVLSPEPDTWEGDYIAANGSAVDLDGEFLYWYQAGRVPRIGLARSTDGIAWTRHPEPVLELGPRGSWDERGVADPYVVRVGADFYMYYLGQDRARRQRLGIARSRDGVVWEKLRDSPILELGPPGAFDETGLGEPAVWAHNGRYWMLYTARDRREYRRLGLATSADGIRWERLAATAAMEGDQSWNDKVICDPTVIAASPRIFHVWFGGGDQAQPAENLNGRIGLGTLILP